MIQWEYQTVLFNLGQPMLSAPRIDQAALNQCLSSAGADGWELAQTQPITLNGHTSYLLLIFKRQ